MIAAGPAKADPKRAGHWLLPVIDSSEGVHTNDSRTEDTPGLGTGQCLGKQMRVTKCQAGIMMMTMTTTIRMMMVPNT
jgi:hypothetical protein